MTMITLRMNIFKLVGTVVWLSWCSIDMGHRHKGGILQQHCSMLPCLRTEICTTHSHPTFLFIGQSWSAWPIRLGQSRLFVLIPVFISPGSSLCFVSCDTQSERLCVSFGDKSNVDIWHTLRCAPILRREVTFRLAHRYGFIDRYPFWKRVIERERRSGRFGLTTFYFVGIQSNDRRVWYSWVFYLFLRFVYQLLSYNRKVWVSLQIGFIYKCFL